MAFQPTKGNFIPTWLKLFIKTQPNKVKNIGALHKKSKNMQFGIDLDKFPCNLGFSRTNCICPRKIRVVHRKKLHYTTRRIDECASLFRKACVINKTKIAQAGQKNCIATNFFGCFFVNNMFVRI